MLTIFIFYFIVTKWIISQRHVWTINFADDLPVRYFSKMSLCYYNEIRIMPSRIIKWRTNLFFTFMSASFYAQNMHDKYLKIYNFWEFDLQWNWFKKESHGTERNFWFFAFRAWFGIQRKYENLFINIFPATISCSCIGIVISVLCQTKLWMFNTKNNVSI